MVDKVSFPLLELKGMLIANIVLI